MNEQELLILQAQAFRNIRIFGLTAIGLVIGLLVEILIGVLGANQILLAIWPCLWVALVCSVSYILKQVADIRYVGRALMICPRQTRVLPTLQEV